MLLGKRKIISQYLCTEKKNNSLDYRIRATWALKWTLIQIIRNYKYLEINKHKKQQSPFKTSKLFRFPHKIVPPVS